MDIFGYNVSLSGVTPSTPQPSAPASAPSGGTQSWGAAALSRAADLGRQFDAGVHTAGAWADKHIDATTEAATKGIEQGTLWAGQKVHQGADAVRSQVTGNDAISQAVRDHVTSAEMVTRTGIGVVGGVAQEGASLVGTAAKVGSTVTQMALSQTRSQEVVTGLANTVANGATAAYDYGKSVIADPTRLGSDATGAWNSVSAPYKQAIGEGHAPETFGMTAGHVLTYVVPVAAGLHAAAWATRATEAVLDTTKVLEAGGTITRTATEAVAKTGVETVAKTGTEVASTASRETVAHEGVQSAQVSTQAPGAANTVGSTSVTTKPALLPGEGQVGTYRDLVAAGSKGDNITPHHIPSANRMAAEGVSKGDGIAINMEQPSPGVGGRHRATFTYGSQADSAMTPRNALAAGVRDARKIYSSDGLYTPQIRSALQQVIDLNKVSHPTVS